MRSLIFNNYYLDALKANQNNIEAIAISTYDKNTRQVDSRFVNLKFVYDKKFIFFTNYNSPKSSAFSSHNQISALLYWPNINVQIRIKAEISKTSSEYNSSYFDNRTIDKNVLAISSDQSKKIQSYEDVIKKFNHIKENADSLECPNYWGGFSFIPYYFEFWEGHESRINKRRVFEKTNSDWKKYILQP